MALNETRLDLETIEAIVADGAQILDLGCGDGTLLARLAESKNVVARGVEISEENVRACITRGLSVRHGNIEEGLADYRDKAFDFVILSQTLAYLNQPRPVMEEMLRVGRNAIISFDNAGYWRFRLRALRGDGAGATLDSDEPRVRSITLKQFSDFSDSLRAHVVKAVFLAGHRAIHTLPALRSTTAVYVLSR
ncbi:MAG: methionine biosynthesis protein MetW [Lentisphaerota bacterium]